MPSFNRNLTNGLNCWSRIKVNGERIALMRFNESKSPRLCAAGSCYMRLFNDNFGDHGAVAGTAHHRAGHFELTGFGWHDHGGVVLAVQLQL